MKTVRIKTKSSCYSIFIKAGLLSQSGEIIEKKLRPSTIFIVTDKNVKKYHLETTLNSFSEKPRVITLPAGEKTKSFESYAKLCEKLLRYGADRKSLLVALGGGVIGDLCGFAASTVLRGISYVQIPTTLLSQVDSSVGGKTAINSKIGKNLVGAFYQPKMVIIDPKVLKTLPTRHFRNGYAEVVKIALILDQNLFSWLETNSDSIFNLKLKSIEYLVEKCCRLKARIIEEDEKEQGLRSVLNYGHTFGHAIESATNYRLLHGEAVSIGMSLANSFNKLDQKYAKRIRNHLKAAGLPVDLKKLKVGSNVIYKSILKDKKTIGSKITLILISKIGQYRIGKNISHQELKSFLKAQLS